MTLTLDPQTEQRIQQAMDDHGCTDPCVVINRAIDVLVFNSSWTEEEKLKLGERFAIAKRQLAWGEEISDEQLREEFAKHLAARAN